MKRLFYILLIPLVFCAGLVVGRNQVLQRGNETNYQKGALEKEINSGLELATQGPSQSISKEIRTDPEEFDKGKNAFLEESMASAKQFKEDHEIFYEMSDDDDEAAAYAHVSPVDAYQLDDLRDSMEEAGLPEEKIEQALEALASGGVNDSASGWFPSSQEELDEEEIRHLLETGLSLEDIKDMTEALLLPPPPSLPIDENMEEYDEVIEEYDEVIEEYDEVIEENQIDNT